MKIKPLLFGGPGASTAFGDLVLAITRVGIGAYMFLGHGLDKLNMNAFKGMVEGTKDLGFPIPTFFAAAATAAETLFAILVAIGLMTRPAALVLVINMAIAAFMVHANDPWFMKDAGNGGSKEMAILFLLPFLIFAVLGGGRYSIDRYLR